MSDRAAKLRDVNRRSHAFRMLPFRERLIASIAIGTKEECWEWLASRYTTGYGKIRRGDREEAAHRMAYEEFVGPIPDGRQLDHLCANRGCCNPDHLEPVTASENVQRGYDRRPPQATCAQGHALVGDNVFHNGRQRRCRTCVRQWHREYEARRRRAA